MCCSVEILKVLTGGDESMDTAFDLWAWLLAVATGFILLMITAWRRSNDRPGIFGLLRRLLHRRHLQSGFELRDPLASASDLRSTMRSLPYWAQLEMAEHLILEGPPCAAIALDAVSHIAQATKGDLRRNALSFLTSRSIPFVARLSLADRLLESTTDDKTKIAALEALCAMASEPDVHRAGLFDSLTYTVADRITDSSPDVQAFAADSLEGALREGLPAMDDVLAKRLSTTRGEPLQSLIRFIDRNGSLVPQASQRARLFDSRQ
jgi:hypothetical protein